MDVTPIPCGRDGWAHLAAVIDCHNREVVGYEFALRSGATEAERAVEAACLQRFGTLRPTAAPVLRSDNGLIFPEPPLPAGLAVRQMRRKRLCRVQVAVPAVRQPNGLWALDLRQ